MMKSRSIVRPSVVALGLVAGLCVSASAQVTLVLSDGGTVQSEQVSYREASRTYMLVDRARGRQAERSARDVVDVRMPRPQGLDAAVAAASKPATRAEGISALAQIVDDHIGLRWDVVAGERLAELYNASNQYRETVRMAERIMRASKSHWLTVGLQRAYLHALVASGNHNGAELRARELVRTGHPPSMALGFLVRGESLAAQNKLEDALLDGYLRTIVLFPNVHSVRPEAMARAVKALERMRDPRAANMRQRLLDAYPNSPYARGEGGL